MMLQHAAALWRPYRADEVGLLLAYYAIGYNGKNVSVALSYCPCHLEE
jgi:hypothetical protein